MASSPHVRTGRLTELDALRGIGALCVLVFHYSTRFHELFPQAQHVPFSFPGGNYRVLLFFTISGFAIFFTLDRIGTVGSEWSARNGHLGIWLDNIFECIAIC